MDVLFDWLTDWIKQGLIDGIMGQYAGIYDSINSKVVSIAADVGQTPQSFHSGVFSMIRTLSDTAIIPIAGMILTFVLSYELIQMIIERNNMHDGVTCRWCSQAPHSIYEWWSAFAAQTNATLFEKHRSRAVID
jgi:hypothetical protein